MVPDAQFQRLQNRVAAAFLAALPEHNPVFSGDWGSASTSRNQAFPRRWKYLVFRICIYRCIACYDDGFCIALDDGEKCVCVQSISYSLICKWFRAAVLPMDQELEAALFPHLGTKQCAVCGKRFLSGSNRAKYCPDCAATKKRHNAAKRKRKQRAERHALEDKKPL